MPVEFQVLIIYVVTRKLLLDVPVSRIGEFEESFFEYIKTSYPEIPESIAYTKELSEEMEEKLKKAIADFKDDFLGNNK